MQDLGDVAQPREAESEGQSTDFNMIWQALRMQCTARQQQIEGNMAQGQSAINQEGKISSAIQKAQENGFEFRYIGNEDEID